LPGKGGGRCCYFFLELSLCTPPSRICICNTIYVQTDNKYCYAFAQARGGKTSRALGFADDSLSPNCPFVPPPPEFSHVSHYMCKWVHFGLCVYSIQPSLQKRAYYFFSLSFETWGKAHGGQAGVRHDIMYMTLCTYLSDYNTSIIVQYSSTRVLEYSSTAVSIHNKNKLLANCEDRIGSSSLFIKYYRYRYIRAQSILEPARVKSLFLYKIHSWIQIWCGFSCAHSQLCLPLCTFLHIMYTKMLTFSVTSVAPRT
jgi:hypothetical protein